jgi:hypothetical protein
MIEGLHIIQCLVIFPLIEIGLFGPWPHKQMPVQKITISVQELPEAECQHYTRQLQMTEGLLALVANVARMSVDLLSEICKGPLSMTARVSMLERLVAKQTTVSQEWKMLQDAAKATEAQRKQGEFLLLCYELGVGGELKL